MEPTQTTPKRSIVRNGGERSGTQSIERTFRLLREICTRSHYGWEVAELAKRCALKESTVRRMLGCLLRERMVRRNPRDGRYLPGGLMFEIGMALPAYADFQRLGEERLARFARRTRSVASLYLRSGDEYVCIVRLGDSPTKGLSSVRVGSRHPLVLSSGGLAMLAALPRREATEVAQRNLEYLRQVGDARIMAARRAVRRSLAEGMGLNEDLLIPGINAFALAICDSQGGPFAALSIAGTSAKLPSSRLAEFRKWLDEEARALAAIAQALFGADGGA